MPVLIYIAFESFGLDLLMALTTIISIQRVWSKNLWQEFHTFMLLSGSTNTFGTNGTSGCSKQFKLIRHFLSTEGWPAQWDQLYDFIGYSFLVQQKCSHLYFGSKLFVSIIDILRYSYLILCHLPYNTYNLIEISVVYDNLFSTTITHYNMSYIINIIIHIKQ